MKLSQGYEQEQKDLCEKIESLRTQISRQQEDRTNIEAFLKQIRKYTRITELTTVMLNELVERIEVYAPDKSSGKRVQRIHVRFNYVGVIGKLELPIDPPSNKIPKKSAKNG